MTSKTAGGPVIQDSKTEYRESTQKLTVPPPGFRQNVVTNGISHPFLPQQVHNQIQRSSGLASQQRQNRLHFPNEFRRNDSYKGDLNDNGYPANFPKSTVVVDNLADNMEKSVALNSTQYHPSRHEGEFKHSQRQPNFRTNSAVFQNGHTEKNTVISAENISGTEMYVERKPDSKQRAIPNLRQKKERKGGRREVINLKEHK